ncbi:hypothetical protein E1B28_008290 [Marasmius oreades]|uniref:AB hydrolase-1 domain-containing protein n=1 Tax=Marasmius oreades TaxID=181124 RepID=A0A9P7RY71_9AGAR|nr:uncharacterized protein E1B28_008290 [Marasmius oreades]KAG7091889.1 hypothetical protein E1B28_008290 [Marasmius oreades]
MRTTPLLTTIFFLSSIALAAAPSGFNPNDYKKQSVTCQAVKRDAGDTIIDITMSYVDINPAAKKTLLLVHGWPSLWSTWSYQIQEFKNDYRLVIPDLRGFGDSTHPDDVESSGTMFDHVGDLACVLKDAKVDSAICVGHDWGSAVCYEAARSRPHLIEAVVGVAVPYIPAAGDYVPVKHLVPVLPKLAYQLFFSGKTKEAIAELDKDIKRTVRATLRTGASPPPPLFLSSAESFLAAWSEIEEIPPVPFFSAEEEEYFIEQYKKQGFRNTLQFYTDSNRYATWKFAKDQGNHTIPQPVFAVLPKHDPVADWAFAAKLLKSEIFLPKLTTKMIDGGHWAHLEYPEEFNAALKRWLDGLQGQLGEGEHVFDEL